MAKASKTKATASKAAKKAGPPKKVIAKKASQDKKVIEKSAPPKAEAKAVKKEAVAPKKNAKSYTPEKSLDLCLILDCTSSMSSWIVRSKDTLVQIIDTVKSENVGLKVRVGFVAYRDVKDYGERFDVFDFSEDI